MIALALGLLLSATSMSGRAVLCFRANIVPTSSLAMDLERVDPAYDGAQRLTVRSTGRAYDLLLVDRWRMLRDLSLTVVAGVDGSIRLDTRALIAVYEYPARMAPGEVVALVRRGVSSSSFTVARL